MNNKMIGKCLNCDQDYCQECCDNLRWEEFCSFECDKEYTDELKQNKDENQPNTKQERNKRGGEDG